jgi:chitinase
MRLFFLLLASCLTGGVSCLSFQQGDHPLSSLLSKDQYEKAFPHHNAIYTYEALIKAAASFPLFAAEKDLSLRKRELAAFFAHIGHETGNEPADGTTPTSNDGSSAGTAPSYAWGLYYTEEQACLDGHCTVYNTGGNSTYKPVPGKSYFGRGPLQLSYAYNYGLAGEELDLPILTQPELVSHDGVVAFKTAIWFWMRPQDAKPSCHDVICGKWKPTPEDLALKRRPGFGMTINIINGGLECNTNDDVPKEEREERIGFYKHMAALLQVTIEKDCDCADMTPYN